MKIIRIAGFVAAALALGCAEGGTGKAGAGDHTITVPDGLADVTLDDTVTADLLYLREEEKLARDVYAALQAFDPAFVNIGSSEQTHMDAVGALLTRYGLRDPAEGRAPGEFEDPTLQALYTTLVARGSASRVAALDVGAEIEEFDLADLNDALTSTELTDVLSVYEQLARGSRNHLRAFDGKLVAEGITYTPQHLDAEAYTAVVTSPRERGRR